MTTIELHKTVIEAASWKLASLLTRRHPELLIRREHPGGGQYDVLAVRSDRGCNIQMNRAGRIHVHGRHDGRDPVWEPTEWQDVIGPDYRLLVERLEAAAGLEPATRAPRSTRRVLVYRTLSALANIQILSDPVDISMGFLDTSGYGAGPADWVDEFPDLAEAARGRTSTEGPEPRFNYWQAKTAGLNVAFDVVSGQTWSTGGDRLDLEMTYELGDRSMPSLLASVLEFGSAS